MSDEPGVSGEQRELLSRPRVVVEAKDAEIGVLRQELAAERELRRRLELRLAELERRLSMDSTDSGTPSSKERIGAKEARRARQQAVSGYWHSLATLARWCRIRSYLDSAAAHGINALDAIRGAHRKALATATPRTGLTPIHGTPREWTREASIR